MTKHALIVMLVTVNLVLLGLFILTAYTPPAAMAQEAAFPENQFILFAAEADRDNEAVYLLDAQRHRLHAFRTNFPRYPDAPIVIAWLHSRDLRQDFRLKGLNDEQ